MTDMKDLCVIHGAYRAEEEDPLACWEYDGVRDCVFLDALEGAETAERCKTHVGSMFTGDSDLCEAAEGMLPPWEYGDDDGQCVAESVVVRYENCKHADSLIVERNYGFRWVTCTACLTEFMPQVDRDDLRAAVVPLLDLEAAWVEFERQGEARIADDENAWDIHAVVYAALGLGEPTSQGGET